MINYNPKNWSRFIFNMHRSGVMRNLAPTLVLVALASGGMCYVFLEQVELHIPAGLNIHAIVGVVLGLVLVFRTNTAYDRWWEGRKQFGALTNHSRNMALKLSAMLAPEDSENRAFFARTIPNFYTALKEHLREGVKLEELDLDGLSYSDEVRRAEHIPNAIAGTIQYKMNQLLAQKKIDGDQFRVINREAEGLIDVLGACERIRKTPIPYSYSMYVKKVIFIYVLTLPISLINSLHYWTIPMAVFSCYVLAGLELIGEEIEDPFGLDANDLDTDGMSVNIRDNVREILLGGADE